MYIIIVIRNGRAHVIQRDGTGAPLRVHLSIAETYINAIADQGDFAIAYRI